MDAPDTYRVLLFAILAIISAIPACYLLYRAVRTRWHVLVYMSLTLFFFAATTFFSYVVKVPDAVRAFVSLDYPVFLVWFVRHVYTRTPSSRRQSTIVFIAILSLKAVHAIGVILFGVSIPAREPVSDALLVPFCLHAATSISMVSLSFAWYAVNSYKAYHESMLRRAPRWVIKRNRFVMLSAVMYVFVPLTWLLFPIDDAGFSSPLYFIPSTVALIAVILFIILTFLGWVAPEWFKRILDKDYMRQTELANRMDVHEQDDEGIWQAAQAYTSSEIIGIVDYIGQNVATVTKRSPAAMKGLLLLAINTQLHDEAVYHASFSEIERVVKGSFKDLLTQSGVEDPEAITSKVLDFLAKNKANLMMIVT